jgi:hypothetical protein
MLQVISKLCPCKLNSLQTKNKKPNNFFVLFFFINKHDLNNCKQIKLDFNFNMYTSIYVYIHAS